MKRTLAALLMVFTAASAHSASSYVSDELEAPLRTGTSLRHKIVRMLKSGAEVQVLQTDKDAGYALVRTADGTQGWILDRYLMSTPSARQRVASAEQALEAVRAENASLKARLDDLTSQKTDVETSYTQLTQDNHRLGQELAQIKKTAANALAIDAQNRTLQERAVNLERELQLVQQENQALADRGAREWFLVGAGVLVLGVLLGLILPRLRLQRRGAWGEL